MKNILTLSFLLLMMSCVSQKIMDTINEVSYNSMTRGNSKNITVIADEISYKTPRENKSVGITSEDRKELINLISRIDLENIGNLKSPTNGRTFDGAMIASITIKKDGKEFRSSNFDDGYPPKELKALVTFLEKLTE